MLWHLKFSVTGFQTVACACSFSELWCYWSTPFSIKESFLLFLNVLCSVISSLTVTHLYTFKIISHNTVILRKLSCLCMKYTSQLKIKDSEESTTHCDLGSSPLTTRMPSFLLFLFTHPSTSQSHWALLVFLCHLPHENCLLFCSSLNEWYKQLQEQILATELSVIPTGWRKNQFTPVESYWVYQSPPG